MPTDENNWVNPQNQQVNPSLAWDQTAQNSGDSDDFDFSFEDSNSENGWMNNDLSWDMQDQMRRQWRSGMFLTPDEVITKSNDNIDMSSGQLDLSSTVQPQRRSGMFLTPDEEATKEETQIEGKQYSFEWAAEAQAEASEDSYLAWIDPNDVDASGDDEEIDLGNKQENDYSQDSLNEEIEDLISFWDEPKTNSEQDSTSKPVETTTATSIETSAEATVETPTLETPVVASPVEQTVEQNVQPIVEDTQVQNTNSTDSTDNWNGWNSEDWLSQEDKKVEESFWTESENISPDVDISPETVGQNVENVINEPVQAAETELPNVDLNTLWDATLDANISAAPSDLHIENMWTDVVENWNWDLISDTWGIQQMNQENTYVPNEAEFTQMSNLLDSSSTGQIDLSNLSNEQPSEQQSESVQQEAVATAAPVVSTEIEQVNNPVMDTPMQSWLESNVDAELSAFQWGEQQWQNISQESHENNTVNEPSAEINLDSLLPGETSVIQWTVQNNETNWSVIWTINGWWQVEQQVQTTPQKKKKKQSWFTVLWIVLWSLILLGLAWFVASKMFPEEFAKLFKKDAIVSGLITDGEENNGDENNVDEGNPDEGNIDESNINEENPNDITWEQELDPDSLAAQLWQEDNTWDWETGENWEDVDNPEWATGDTWDWDQAWDTTETWSWDTWDFDPFAEFGDILEEAKETIEKLNAYVSSWQYYIDLDTKSWAISILWRKVMEQAQGELTKLENWEEIDTTAFDSMDKMLKKLSDLAK